MGELILLRHGETEWSKSGRHTGRTDIPLTPAGEAAAAALAPLLARREIAAAFSSPAQRAVRILLDVGETSQFGGPGRAPRRAGEAGHDLAPSQYRAQRHCCGLAVEGERDVCPSCMPAGLAPLGLTVPQQDQVAHGS